MTTTRVSSGSPPIPTAAVAGEGSPSNGDGPRHHQPYVDHAARQITLTQILTNDGTVTTALVTLDRGTPPTETAVAAPPDPPSSSDGGMPPATIGIIVGCSVGVVVLILIIVLGCIATRRRYYAYDSDSDSATETSVITPEYQQRRPWQFPWSIPPPTLRPGQPPNYRVRPPPRPWPNYH